MVAGQKINPAKFRSHVAYVMQDDSIMATSTPREALEFSASMRLPSTTTKEQITDLVSKLLKSLGLEECADVLVGGALIKGISGGHRKRTSVGVELITRPSLLFLDEPTSGLDSYQAYSCIKLLRTVANDNCAILCTIHQPSSEVFFLFDLVIFMKEGRIVYQGPVKNVSIYFSKFDYHCPANYNPADYAMFVCQTVTAEVFDSKGVFMVDDTLESQSSKKKGSEESKLQDEVVDVIPKVNASFSRQLVYLFYREALNVYRDTVALYARFGITIFLNLLFGLIFLNSGGKDDSYDDNFQSHFGAITFVAINAMFGTSQSILLAFPFERPMFLREYATGTYTAVAYFIGKISWELPMCFLQTLVGWILTYFMCNFQGSFIYLLLTMWGLSICSNSLALVLGCLVNDVKDASEMSILVYVPQMLFAGFFIRLSQIPVYVRWAQYLCALKYAMDLLIVIEFDPTLGSCQGAAAANCHSLFTDNDVSKHSWWIYFLIVFGIFAVSRVIGGILLVQRAKRVV